MLYILCFLLIPLMIDSLQVLDVDDCLHSVMMICCAFDNDWIEEKCLILIGLWVRSSLELHRFQLGETSS